MKNEMLKYLIIGGINTVLTCCLYFVLLQYSTPYLLALILSWFGGILFTYTFNFIWVFKPESTFTLHRRFWRYFTSYLISLGLNLASLNYLVSTQGLDPFLAQMIIMPLIIAFNYTATKFWSLRRRMVIR